MTSVREFAESVLFATTLEEKLARPPRHLTLEDTDPGPPLVHAPALPGRPPDLIPRAHHHADARARFPGDAALIDERRRAVLLHFFANHELLAVELMALALLKFPDAPRAFRRGVLHTLHEEQEHTRWYAKRMAQCGLRFGDLSVSRMIWDQIAPMESPLDFVSRLSLTFEQANLDFAHHYSRVLREAGDPASAAILHRIYRDEIAHVGHGLKWLRRWKEEKQSDWEAWRARLKHPLSPVRAKGSVPFNAEGRRLAGLDESFIRKLRLFQQSRGRSPDIWFFNPAAEEEWAAATTGRPWHAPKKLNQLAADLEAAFALAASEDDIVLRRRPLSPTHHQRLLDAGITPAESILLPDGNGAPPAEAISPRKPRTLRPWADSPSARALAGSLPEFAFAAATSDPLLFSKAHIADWLAAAHVPEALANLDPAPPTRSAHTLEQVHSHLAALAASGHARAVIKPALAAAGRGQARIPTSLLTPDKIKALKRLLTAGPLVVEPFLDAAASFSLQFEARENQVRYLGLVLQQCDSVGRWTASIARPKPASALDPTLAAFLMRDCLPRLHDQIIPLLEQLLTQHPHTGPLGIDTLLYRTPDARLAWRPFLDLNPRRTMGRLALDLRRYIHPQRTLTLSAPPASSFSDPPPPTLRDGKIDTGTLPLTDPSSAALRVATITVS